MSDAVEKVADIKESVSVKLFFETVSPGRRVSVESLAERKVSGGYSTYFLIKTDIQIYCESESCQGVRFFAPRDENVQLLARSPTEHFLAFTCRNCRANDKVYAFIAMLDSGKLSGEMFKVGEVPPFGTPTPAKVITLLGAERDYFLKGRRCENQGLGVAAFAYYRRVVENRKTKIIDEITRVAQKVGAAQEILDDLKIARAENQFTKAVDSIRHGVPQSLLIDGHNPLVLLHSALSEGLHAQTDEVCLELATSIRVVLTELVERMDLALKEEAQLSSAVGRLLQASAVKAGKSVK